MDHSVESVLNEITPRITTAELAPPEVSATLMMAIIDELAIVANSHHDDELAYTLGYCWYNVMCESKHRSQQAQHWLERTLELNSQHAFALLYLGHLFYDSGRYTEALAAWVRVPTGHFFARFNQHWRDLKHQELVLCSRFHTDPTTAPADALQDLMVAYLHTAEIDRPVPLELTQTIAAMPERLEYQTLLRFIEFLMTLEMNDVLETQFKQLTECCTNSRLTADAAQLNNWPGTSMMFGTETGRARPASGGSRLAGATRPNHFGDCRGY